MKKILLTALIVLVATSAVAAIVLFGPQRPATAVAPAPVTSSEGLLGQLRTRPKPVYHKIPPAPVFPRGGDQMPLSPPSPGGL
jgi:hypothetical protein